MTDGGYLVAFAAGVVVGLVAGLGIGHHVKEKQLEQQTFDSAKKYMDISDDLDKANYENDRLKREIEDLKTFPANGHDKEPETNDDESEDDISGLEPMVITEYEYQFKYPRAATISLTYYQGDGILVEDNEQIPILEPEEALGEEAMWILPNVEDDVVYVYNPKANLCYEIGINNGNYSDDYAPEDDAEEE